VIKQNYYKLFIKVFHAMQHRKRCITTKQHTQIRKVLNILLDNGVILSYYQNQDKYFLFFKNKFKFIILKPFSIEQSQSWHQLKNEQKNNFGTIYIYIYQNHLTTYPNNTARLLLKIIRLLVFKLKNATTYIFKNGLEDWMVLFFYADFFNYI
jgi:hypothetical protein